MQLPKARPKAAAHRDQHLGEQRGAVRVEGPVQRPADAVLAQMLHLLDSEPEQAAAKAVHDLALAVDRSRSTTSERSNTPKCPRVGEGAAPMAGGNVPLEQRLHSHALVEVVDEGQGTQPLSMQRQLGWPRRGSCEAGILSLGLTTSASPSRARELTTSRKYRDRQRRFTGENLWARGNFVSTAGLDENMVRADIRNKEQQDERYDQLKLGV